MYLSTDPPSDDIAALAKEELGAAWDKTPTAVLIDKVQRGEFSWIDLLEMDSPKDIIQGTADAFVQHFVDLLASKVPFGASPAASVGDLHIGVPHVHLLPVPHPMPLTVGAITSGCCESVMVRGWPAARVGDFGAAACLCAAPFFKIKTGSSSVFIGGKRAARMFDISQHGVAPMTPTEMVKAVIDGARKSVAVLARGYQEVKACDEEAKRGMEEASRAMLDLLESATGAAGYVSAAAGPAGAAARRGNLAQRVATAAQVSTELRATVAEAMADAASASATASAVAMAGKVAASQMGTDADATAIEAAMALDPTTPPSIGALVTFRDNVVIGGLPTPDIGVPLGPFAKLAPERIRAPLRRADAKIRLPLRRAGARVHARLRERHPRVARALTGDPVDVVTGAVLSEGVDAVLRGRGDLVVRRFYSSAWADRPSPLGRGWSLSLDQAVWVEGGFLVYRTDDGRELIYALPEGRSAADERLDGLILVDPANNLRLVALAGGRWRITGPEGAIVDLQPIAGERRREAHLARAVALRGPGEVRIDLHHDAEGRLVAARGPGGRTLGLRWDAEDRLEALTLPDPEGPGEVEVIRYVRSPADDLIAVVDAAGGRWRYAYDDHRLVEATGPDGRAFHYEYDGRGSEARATRTWGDGGVFERRLCYDTQRRRTVIADGVGGATIVEYDGLGLVSAITDPTGAVRRMVHDAEGRRVAEIDALGGVVRRRYDELGRCVEVIEADESTWSFDHDEEGRVILAIDPLGGRWRWRYDEGGRLVARFEANGAGFERVDDGRGRERIADAEGRHMALSWSDDGDLSTLEDAEGRRWRFTYDRRGRVREVIEPDGRRRRFVHDRADRAIAASTGDALAWRIERDDAGRAIRIERPEDGAVDLAYGPCGGLVRVQGRDRVLEYRRDLEGRLLEILEVGDAAVDASSRPGSGDDLAASPAAPDESLCAGTPSQPRRGGRALHTFSRAIGGALLAERTLDERRLRYRSDAAGRVCARIEASGEETRFEHDPSGRIVAVTYADGASERFAYRGDGALIIARRDEGDASSCVELTRDPSGRLSGEIVGDRWVAIDRDRGGRRRRIRSSEGLMVDLFRSPSGALRELEVAALGGRWRVPVTRRAEGAADEVLHAPRPEPADARGGSAAEDILDEDGRVIVRRDADGGEQRLRWDAAHRLRAVEGADGVTVTFDYDALGRRIRKTCGERTTAWIWDGDLPLHEEVSVAGEVVSRRTWLFDHESFAPVAALIDGRFLEIRCDRIGAPRVALDEAGRVVWRATSALASVDHRGEGEPGLELPFGLPGHYRDRETGLIYSRHRYLDPTNARFLSPDPSGLAGGLDPHAYVDDPATMIDPLGLRGRPVNPETLPGVPPEPASALGRASEGPIPPAPTITPAPGAPTEPRAPRPVADRLLDPLRRGAEILRRRIIKASLEASCRA